MAIRYYDSRDASAPVLTTAAGSFITMLDAILVNGYGTRPSLGWSKVFTDTNIAVYRPPVTSPAGVLVPYLRVVDTSTSEGNFSGYGYMTTANAGTEQFPDPNVSSTIRIPKTANTYWIVVGTDAGFYLHIGASSTFGSSSSSSRLMYFGRFLSFMPNDTKPWCIIGSTTAAGAFETFGNSRMDTSTSTMDTGHFIWQNHSGLFTGLLVLKTLRCPVPVISNAGSVMGRYASQKAFPNPISGTFDLYPVDIHEWAYSYDATLGVVARGQIPGLWSNYQRHNYPFYTNLQGSGNLAGRTFMCFQTFVTSTVGSCFIETTEQGNWFA